MRQFGLEDLDLDDDAEVPVDMQKAKSIVFRKKKNGVYVLPDMSNFKTIRQKQRVIRGYIGATYSGCPFLLFYFCVFLFLIHQ